MNEFMKEIDILVANESVGTEDIALEGANLETWKKIREANKGIKMFTKEARKLAKAANYSAAITQYNKAIALAKQCKSDIAAIPDTKASDIISAFTSAGMQYIANAAALWAKDDKFKETNNWNKKDALLACDRFVQLVENEIKLIKAKQKAVEGVDAESIDDAFEALMSGVETEEEPAAAATEDEPTDELSSSLEALLGEEDIVHPLDVEDAATEGDEGGEAGKKVRFEKLRTVAADFWKKITDGLTRLKTSFSTKIGELKGKKFTLNVKKWGIWQKLVGLWNKATTRGSSKAKEEVVGAAKEAVVMESDEAWDYNEDFLKNHAVVEMEAELDAPDTGDTKEVDGNVVSRVIGTILSFLGTQFSKFKEIPNMIKSKINKGESSNEPGIFQKIAQGIKTIIGAVGGFFSSMYNGAIKLLGKLPKVFKRKKHVAGDGEIDPVSAGDESTMPTGDELDGALEGLLV